MNTYGAFPALKIGTEVWTHPKKNRLLTGNIANQAFPAWLLQAHACHLQQTFVTNLPAFLKHKSADPCQETVQSIFSILALAPAIILCTAWSLHHACRIRLLSSNTNQLMPAAGAIFIKFGVSPLYMPLIPSSSIVFLTTSNMPVYLKGAPPMP